MYLSAVSTNSFFFGLLLLTASASGQSVKSYTGEVQLENGLTGKIEYSYQPSRGEGQVLHGDYTLEVSGTDTLNQIGYVKEIVKGKYEEGLRADVWRFKYFDHTVKVVDVVDFDLRATLSSEVSELVGRYEGGVPEGAWSFSDTQYDQGIATGPVTRAAIPFVKGTISGPFEFDHPDTEAVLTIRGQVVDGLMDGRWAYEYDEDSTQVSEERIYRDGFLTSLVKRDRQTGDTLINVYFKDVETKLKLIGQGDRNAPVARAEGNFGLMFDQGYPGHRQELRAQQAGNARLKNVLERIGRMDTALVENDHLRIGTSRFVYRLNERQKADIKAINTQVDSITRLVQQVNANTVLEINHQQSDSLAWIYRYFQDYGAHLSGLKKLCAFMQKDSFRLVDPVIYVTRFRDYFPASTVVAYNFRERKKTHEVTFNKQTWISLATLKERMAEEEQLLRTLRRHVKREVSSILQSDQLAVLEQRIHAQKELADSAFHALDSLPEAAQSTLRYIYTKHLETHFDELRQQYASADSYEEKSLIGLQLIELSRTLQDMPPLVRAIYERREDIAAAYTETKFDPYTFNYEFQTVRKKRLYDKVAGTLFQSMMQDLREEDDYKALKARVSEVDRLQERLLELLNEDTRKMEKKIRRKNNADEIKELIGI